MTIYRLAELVKVEDCYKGFLCSWMSKCLLPISQKDYLVLQKCVSDVDPRITHRSVLLMSQWVNNPVKWVILSGAVRGATTDQNGERAVGFFQDFSDQSSESVTRRIDMTLHRYKQFASKAHLNSPDF